MKASNARYAFLALVASTILYTGCQNEASSGIRGQVKAAGQVTSTSQEDQKLDELVKEGNSLKSCTSGIKEKNVALIAEMDRTITLVNSNRGSKQITSEDSKSLLAHSNQIKALVRAMNIEFLNQKVSACGSGDDLISIEGVRTSSNELFLSIAEVLGKETPESALVKQNKKQKDAIKTGAVLAGQNLRPTKELLAVLDEDNQKNFTFVIDGKIASTKENYQKALESSGTGVCLLEKAPSQKLKEDAVLTVLSPVVTSTEIVTYNSDQEATQKTTIQLVVPMSSGDQVLSFNCRLGKELKQESAAKQFLKILGSLLAKSEAK